MIIFLDLFFFLKVVPTFFCFSTTKIFTIFAHHATLPHIVFSFGFLVLCLGARLLHPKSEGPRGEGEVILGGRFFVQEP